MEVNLIRFIIIARKFEEQKFEKVVIFSKKK